MIVDGACAVGGASETVICDVRDEVERLLILSVMNMMGSGGEITGC